MISSPGKISILFCQLCGRKILGSGKTFHHKKWPRDVLLKVCQTCFLEKPRCQSCDIPMASVSTNGICTTCQESLRLCLACHSPVSSKYYEFDGVGPYCKECYRNRSPCDVCGAPLTDDQWRLSDGRVTCAQCHDTAIYLPADANTLFADVKQLIEHRLGLKLNVPTGLALVDRNQLREVIRQQNEGHNGNNDSRQLGNDVLDPEHTQGIYARRGIRRGIYIQTGLPRMLFLQIASHEYAHAWQGENCPLLSDSLLHEGFAEWVAFHVMGYYRYTKGQERMLTREDNYGRGLRWTLDLEAKLGERGVIETYRRSVVNQPSRSLA
jgi:hypothetical protein